MCGFFELYFENPQQDVENSQTDINPQQLAVDGILKRENENPTVGLLICKTKDNVLAKYAVNTMNVPIGISEYDMNNFVKEHFKSSMPTIAEIENELSDK